MECSVWIESKLFVFRSRGRGNFCIVEKCRKFTNALYLYKDVVVWLAKAVEDCSKFSGNKAPYQTRREGNRVFLIQLCQNSYGRFVKLTELGTSKGKGTIAIPEGRNGSGWEVFVKKARELVGSTYPVLVSANKGVFNNDTVVKASLGKETSGPSKVVSRKEAVKTVRNMKEGSKDVCRRNFSAAGTDCLHSQKLQKIGEVEGSLWQVQSELLGWKEKLDFVLKIVDVGLGLISDLVVVSNVQNEVTLRKQTNGPSSIRNGLVRDPLMRPVIQDKKSHGWLQSSSSPTEENSQPRTTAAPTAGSSSQNGSTVKGDSYGHTSVVNSDAVIGRIQPNVFGPPYPSKVICKSKHFKDLQSSSKPQTGAIEAVVPSGGIPAMADDIVPKETVVSKNNDSAKHLPSQKLLSGLGDIPSKACERLETNVFEQLGELAVQQIVEESRGSTRDSMEPSTVPDVGIVKSSFLSIVEDVVEDVVNSEGESGPEFH